MLLEALSIVVPAHDEAQTIERTVEDAFAVARGVSANVEVVVCDDASTDATGRLLDGMAEREPRLRVLRHAERRGIEPALRTLYASARHPWVFLNSADLQWPMSALVPLAEAAASGADLVVGARKNKREVYTPYRRLVSKGYSLAARACGAPVTDPGCIKLGRRELMDRALVARGVFAEGERIVRAARDGARVEEVAVEFRPRRAGRATGARPEVVARALLDAGRVACSLVLGVPSPERSR